MFKHFKPKEEESSVPRPPKSEPYLSNDQIENFLRELCNDSANWMTLSKWEQDFVDSVSDQFVERGTLTERQMVKLEDIYFKL